MTHHLQKLVMHAQGFMSYRKSRNFIMEAAYFAFKLNAVQHVPVDQYEENLTLFVRHLQEVNEVVVCTIKSRWPSIY